MKLNPSIFRSVTAEAITRENIDRLLDNGCIEVKMINGNWWKIRRNGKTRLWKRDPNRIRIPIKYGLRGTTTIYEADFNTPV